MAFDVVVEERGDFERWLDHQSSPARSPSNAHAQRGQEVLFSSGCGACHTVRGTEADGVIGPDLTHVGGRSSLAAGVLPNDVKEFRRWLAHPERIKPGVTMPSFAMLPEEDLEALATYLKELD